MSLKIALSAALLLATTACGSYYSNQGQQTSPYTYTSAAKGQYVTETTTGRKVLYEPVTGAWGSTRDVRPMRDRFGNASIDVHVHKDQKPGDVSANGESGSALR